MGDVVALGTRTLFGQRPAGLRLGQWLREGGLQVCVVEADLQSEQMREAVDGGREGLAYLHPAAPVTLVSLRASMVKDARSGLDVLLGPATPAEASPVWCNAAAYRGVLTALAPAYDVVVVNLPTLAIGQHLRTEILHESADVSVLGGTPGAALIRTAKDVGGLLRGEGPRAAYDEALVLDLRNSPVNRLVASTWDGTEPNMVPGALERLTEEAAEVMCTLLEDSTRTTGRGRLLGGSALVELCEQATLLAGTLRG